MKAERLARLTEQMRARQDPAGRDQAQRRLNGLSSRGRTFGRVKCLEPACFRTFVRLSPNALYCEECRAVRERTDSRQRNQTRGPAWRAARRERQRINKRAELRAQVERMLGRQPGSMSEHQIDIAAAEYQKIAKATAKAKRRQRKAGR